MDVCRVCRSSEFKIEQRSAVEIDGVMDGLILGIVHIEHFHDQTYARLNGRKTRSVDASEPMGVFFSLREDI